MLCSDIAACGPSRSEPSGRRPGSPRCASRGRNGSTPQRRWRHQDRGNAATEEEKPPRTQRGTKLLFFDYVHPRSKSVAVMMTAMLASCERMTERRAKNEGREGKGGGGRPKKFGSMARSVAPKHDSKQTSMRAGNATVQQALMQARKYASAQARRLASSWSCSSRARALAPAVDLVLVFLRPATQ